MWVSQLRTISIGAAERSPYRERHKDMSNHGHRYPGSAAALRSAERMALLEVGRVVDLCLDGGAIGSVLDIGTGSGVFAEEFDRRGLAVTGIDVNPAMLEAAQQHVPHVRFLEASADALPFHDGEFDLAFLGHVLHEVSDPVHTLTEARRVARVRVAVLEWPYLAEEHGPPLDHRLRDAAVVAFARDAGFQHVEQLPLAHMALYRLTA